MAGRAGRAGVALVVVVLAVAGLAVGGRVLWHSAQSAVRPDGCDFGSYHLDLDQAQVASTVVGVVLHRKLPERAAVLTLAAALQESKLRNLGPGEGDRDSVGILQQRPSQGWGTAAQIADVHYATGKFLDAVVQGAELAERLAGHRGAERAVLRRRRGLRPARGRGAADRRRADRRQPGRGELQLRQAERGRQRCRRSPAR